MAGVSTPAFAAAASNAGALGGLGLSPQNVDAARKIIRETRRLTTRAFGANFFLHVQPPAQPQDMVTRLRSAYVDKLYKQYERSASGTQAAESIPPLTSLKAATQRWDENFLEMVLQEKVPVVTFHFGIPDKGHVKALQDAGILVSSSATNAEEAHAIAAAGLDFMTAQGAEAGGHRGTFLFPLPAGKPDARLSTFDLLKQILNDIKTVPVVAAGGIMTGQDIHRALSMGAAAAQLGTAFLCCPESMSPPSVRSGLPGLAKQFGTVLTHRVTGRPARFVSTSAVTSLDKVDPALILPYPDQQAVTGPVRQVSAKSPLTEHSIVMAGANAAKARTNVPAGAVVRALVDELEQCKKRSRDRA